MSDCFETSWAFVHGTVLSYAILQTCFAPAAPASGFSPCSPLVALLMRLPVGALQSSVAAHTVRLRLSALDAAIAKEPSPMQPRDDIPVLAALELTWPEERQRLQLALENLVRAVKGDANRRLQLLQSYLAELDAGALSAEDAAAMVDALVVQLADDDVEFPSRPRYRAVCAVVASFTALRLDGGPTSKPVVPTAQPHRRDCTAVLAAVVGVAVAIAQRTLRSSLPECTCSASDAPGTGHAKWPLVVACGAIVACGCMARFTASPWRDSPHDRACELYSALARLRALTVAGDVERRDGAIYLTDPAQSRRVISDAVCSLSRLNAMLSVTDPAARWLVGCPRRT